LGGELGGGGGGGEEKHIPEGGKDF